MAEKSLPLPPTARGRAPRISQRSALHGLRPLPPVSEVPHPSELQTLQLENDILNQKLAAKIHQVEEMDCQVVSLKKENNQYRGQIDRQNHLIAQIANTLDLVFTEYRVAAEQFQRSAEHEEKNGWI